MRFLDAIENTVLWFTDQDWAWWPFFVARPKQTEPFSRNLVVDLAMIAAVEVVILAFASIVIRGDVEAYGAAIPVFLALALGIAVFMFWGAIVSAAAVCWNRRASRLSGTRLGSIPPRESSPETDRITFWLVVLSTVAFFQVTCGGGSVPSDCGQGLGLFWHFCWSLSWV